MSVIVLNLDDPPTATLKELPPPVDWEARQASLERLEKSDIVIQEFMEKYNVPNNWDEGSETAEEMIERLNSFIDKYETNNND